MGVDLINSKIWIYWRTMIFLVKNWQLRCHRSMHICWRYFWIIKFFTSARYSRRNCLRITKTKNFFISMFILKYKSFNCWVSIFLYVIIYMYVYCSIFLTFKYLFVYLRYNVGWEKYEQDMLNVEESFVEYEVHLN